MSPPPILIQSPDSSTGWWAAPAAIEVRVADSLDRVLPLLAKVEAWAENGGWAVGFIGYEAGPAFEATLGMHTGETGVDRLPLAWFALCDRPLEVEPPRRRSIEPVDWRQALDRDDYIDRLATIHREIRRGNTYQVNFTVPLRTESPPGPRAWFAATYSRHPLACQALIEVPAVGGRGPWSIVSLSPELFFSLDGSSIHSRPMKGTRRSGRDASESARIAAELAASDKDHAENVMIVDMIRNDLGRVARPGSVCVPKLFEVEHHPTVLQMTSTVEARTNASLVDIFGALFPCASITGAPKIATSRIIADLEVQPRGVYTGAIGWVGPNSSGESRRARFGVAIRTAVIDHRQGIAEYGVGSGVVWDSEPEKEYQECLTKAVSISRSRTEYDLFETLLWEPSRGLVLAERHKQRLLASARHFGQPLDPKAVDAVLDEIESRGFESPQRLRIIVAPDGTIRVENTELDQLPTPLSVTFVDVDSDPDDPRLWHKTTAREIYDRALAAHPEVDDVLLINRNGEVTESTRANVVLRHDGRWLTPRREAGLLNGTLRAELLDEGVIEEATVTPAIVCEAAALYLVNSVRGWMPARIAG